MRAVAVCGATATGKSKLAIRIAETMNGEIVNCDSMQIYRGMEIGTAKPSPSDRARVPHHMFDVADIENGYSAAEYGEAARRVIDEIESRDRVPVICGGTGLYLDAVVYDNKYSVDDNGDAMIRGELYAYAAQNGADALHERLAAVDKASADAIHKNNVRRVARALEIYIRTGRPKSEWDTESRRDGIVPGIAVLGVRYRDRERHRTAIRKRCEKMIESGLVDEARALYESGMLTNGSAAAQAIGYKEFVPYLRGEETIDEAVDRLYYDTCRYAKRQATWFYKKDYIKWLYADEMSEDEMLVAAVEYYNEVVKTSDSAH